VLLYVLEKCRQCRDWLDVGILRRNAEWQIHFEAGSSALRILLQEGLEQLREEELQ